ncbi:MAG: methyltransferase domain-containing protein [Bradymonadales bacterium]|nr:methyltransferase domain-containing protein [Bradymonadales bacterium]
MSYEPLPDDLEKVVDLEYVTRCPACHTGPLEFTSSGARCGACDRHYLQHHGLLDFLPLDNIRHNLNQVLMESRFYAPIYERYSRPYLTRLVTSRSLDEEYDLAVDLLRLKQGQSVLDIACGTGNFSRRFAAVLRSSGFVVGLDRSQPMLIRGELLRTQNRLSNLYFIRGDALHLPFMSDSFDRVHCGGAIHMFKEIGTALSEIHRVLREGGLLVLSTFISAPSPWQRLVRTLVSDPFGFHWFPPIELERLLTSHRFVIDWHSTSGAALTLRAVAYK